jgi:hypothetical protein
MDNVLQACKVLVCELAMLWMTQAHCESFSRLVEIYQSRWERISREIDAQTSLSACDTFLVGRARRLPVELIGHQSSPLNQ